MTFQRENFVICLLLLLIDMEFAWLPVDVMKFIEFFLNFRCKGTPHVIVI